MDGQQLPLADIRAQVYDPLQSDTTYSYTWELWANSGYMYSAALV